MEQCNLWNGQRHIILELTVPHIRTSYGDQSFDVNDPVVWNSLPAEVCSQDISA